MKKTLSFFLIIIFLFSIQSCDPSKEQKIRYLSVFHRITECGIRDLQNCLVFATLINEDTIRTGESGYFHNLARLDELSLIGKKDIEISQIQIKKMRDPDKSIKIKSLGNDIIVNLLHFYDTLLPDAMAKWKSGDKDPTIINILQMSLDQNIRECKMLYERLVEFSTKNGLEKNSWEHFSPCKQSKI